MIEKGGNRLTSLSDLKPGKKGKIIKMSIKGSVGIRYREMGLSPGEVIKVERVAPAGDPIEIEVKGYHLSIRKDEARLITVKETF